MDFKDMFKCAKNTLMGKKKGQLGTLQNLVISVVVIGFILVIGLILMARLQDTTTVNSVEANATQTLIDAVAEIPDWMPIIILAVVALAVLSIVYLFQRKTQ